MLGTDAATTYEEINEWLLNTYTFINQCNLRCLLLVPRSSSRPGPSGNAACRKLLLCGRFSVLPPKVEANERSAFSALGVDPSSSVSDVPVPVPVLAVCELPLPLTVANWRPDFSNFCRRTDLRSSSSFMAVTLKSLCGSRRNSC